MIPERTVPQTRSRVPRTLAHERASDTERQKGRSGKHDRHIEAACYLFFPPPERAFRPADFLLVEREAPDRFSDVLLRLPPFRYPIPEPDTAASELLPKCPRKASQWGEDLKNVPVLDARAATVPLLRVILTACASARASDLDTFPVFRAPMICLCGIGLGSGGLGITR